MALIRISNIGLNDLYKKQFWDNITSVNNQLSVNEKPYEILWTTLNKETAKKYFNSNEELFYQWLDMLNNEQFENYTEIILTNDELIIDDNKEYLQLINKQPTQPNKSQSLESIGVINTFHDLFNEIKSAVHKYGAVITYQANTVILAANEITILNALKRDILSSGFIISHKMILDDIITQKNISIYVFTITNPICLS